MNICQTWLALASKNRAWQFGNICDSSDDLWQAFANGHLCGIALPFHQEVPGGLASPEMASYVSFVKAVTLKGRGKKTGNRPACLRTILILSVSENVLHLKFLHSQRLRHIAQERDVTAANCLKGSQLTTVKLAVSSSCNSSSYHFNTTRLFDRFFALKSHSNESI